MLLPVRSVTDEPPIGVLIAGFSPRLVVDDAYRGFFELVATEISASVAEARSRGRERQRLERLAELDRTKTEFFSNVSHEFRTPLTLMLGPLDDLLDDGDDLPPRRKAELELVRRNARRLLQLAGKMLDFSQIEAGRMRARFAPVELAQRRARSSPKSRAPLRAPDSTCASSSKRCPSGSGSTPRCGRRSSRTCSPTRSSSRSPGRSW
jgi:signal transduction histidine kinase